MPSRNRTPGAVRTLADRNRSHDGGSGSDDDDDEPQEYYTGGERSAMLVQDPTKRYNVDAIFDQARNSGAVERPAGYLEPTSTSRSFPGTGRSVSGHTASSAPQPPASVNHTVTLRRNGFTVNDGPLRSFEDPANESFLERIKQSECPKELEPADRMTQVHLNLVRREENYSELKKPRNIFPGMGRTLRSSSSGTTILDASEPNASAASLKTAPIPSLGLAVDSSSPTTSIQLRLADGTRMVSCFNLNHTIRDIRAFIDASRPGGARNISCSQWVSLQNNSQILIIQ